MRQRGNGDESRARALRADQGLYKTKLESNSEPERARVCQRVAVRARVGVTESQRVTGRDPVRA